MIELLIMFLLAGTIFLIYRHQFLQRAIGISQFSLGENFYKALDYELKIIDKNKKYISKYNNSILEIQIPSLDAKNFAQSSYEDIYKDVEGHLDYDNLKVGIKDLSINNIPYFANINRNKVLPIIGSYIVKNIPELKKCVLSIVKRVDSNDNIHNQILTFWITLNKEVESFPLSIQKEFLDFCNQAYSFLNDFHDENATKGSAYFSENSKSVRLNSLKTERITMSDIKDIGLMVGLTYFLFDLDDIDIVDFDFDEVISDEILDSFGNALDTLGTGGLPMVSIWRETKKQNRLRAQNLSTAEESWANGTISVAAKATGAIGGAKLGSAIGTVIFPGIGTLVGGLIGSLGGAILGTMASKKLRHSNWVEAVKKYNSAVKNYLDELKNKFIDLYDSIREKIGLEQSEFTKVKSKLIVKEPISPKSKVHTNVIFDSINSDVALIEKSISKLKKLYSKKAKMKIEELEEIKSEYLGLLKFMSENRVREVSFSKAIRSLPILRGGEVDRNLVNEKNKVNDFNLKIIVGYIVWHFDTLRNYNLSLDNIIKHAISIREKIDQDVESQKNELNNLKTKAERLKAQI